jgi:hypothetical protein
MEIVISSNDKPAVLLDRRLCRRVHKPLPLDSACMELVPLPGDTSGIVAPHRASESN